MDRLKGSLEYLPITTAAMIRAAELWAHARQQGHPTAADRALDGDVISAAQAQLLQESAGEALIIATLNVGHLIRFADARHWSDIGWANVGSLPTSRHFSCR